MRAVCSPPTPAAIFLANVKDFFSRKKTAFTDRLLTLKKSPSETKIMSFKFLKSNYLLLLCCVNLLAVYSHHRQIINLSQGLPTLPEYLGSHPILVGFVLLDLLFCRSLFVLYLFAIVLSVLRFTAFDYTFGFFKLSLNGIKRTNLILIDYPKSGRNMINQLISLLCGKRHNLHWDSQS